jgi:hypothetical protein
MSEETSFHIQGDIWSSCNAKFLSCSEDPKTEVITKIKISNQGVPKEYFCNTEEQQAEAKVVYDLLAP